MKSRVLPMLSALALILSVLSPVAAHEGEHPEDGKPEGGWPGSAKGQEVARAMLADSQPAVDAQAQSATTCTDGFAGEYRCENVDLMAYVPLADMGGGKANDIWGWTDPDTGREYALQGRTSGTSFVDITDPMNPVYVGNLPTTRFNSTWRDVKVYGNYAFIVSEARNHGMQVFDLTRLGAVTSPPVTFSADARYTGFHTAHNIAINEVSGFAYAIGTDTCSGGLHIVDIRNPLSPVQAGCYSGDGYTHDTQCVTYTGPDNDHNGAFGPRKEICFASNEDTVTIVDVTDKSAPRMLAKVSYPGVQYTHQGWLTGDQRYFLVDDELDESRNGHVTHTYVFDMVDLDAPKRLHTFAGTTAAIDHNQYIVGNHSFQSNYRAGLRIVDVSDKQALREVAYFDTYPADDNADFNGSWSNYPFFSSGIVVVSDVERGLFVVRPNLGTTEPTNAAPLASFTYACDNLACAFDGSGSSDADGTIASHAWDFGDGTTGSGASTSRTYSVAGTYKVTLTVTDNDGASDTESKTLTVGTSGTMHLGDIDGTKELKGKSGRWEAFVTVTVHDATEAGVEGATVTGTWSGDAGGTVTGTTSSAGSVTFATGTLPSSTSTVTFTVDGVTHTSLTYAAADNHDADNDTNVSVTSITLTKT